MNVPSIARSRRSNRLILSDSEHRLQILQQLWPANVTVGKNEESLRVVQIDEMKMVLLAQHDGNVASIMSMCSFPRTEGRPNLKLEHSLPLDTCNAC